MYAAARMNSGGFAGLRPDVVPAILQRGERLLSRRHPALACQRLQRHPNRRESAPRDHFLALRFLERQVVISTLRRFDRLRSPGSGGPADLRSQLPSLSDFRGVAHFSEHPGRTATCPFSTRKPGGAINAADSYSELRLIEFTRRPERVCNCKHCLGSPCECS